MKIYIACGLTHIPRENFDIYTGFVHKLAQSIKDEGDVVKYALVDSDPQLANKPKEDRAKLCYLWDINMVSKSDLIIAEVSYPSAGVGIELQAAQHIEIPIILCYRDFGDNKSKPAHYKTPDNQDHKLQIGEGYISLMVLGLPSVFKVIKYDSEDGGIKSVIEAINLVKKK
jgi:hypothetical protein